MISCDSIPKAPRFDPKDADLQLLHDHFAYFLEAFYHESGLNEVAPIGEVELDMAHYVQHGPNDRIVKAFRGVGKTTMFTVLYALWRLLRNPQIAIKVVSKTSGHARDVVRECRERIEQAWFLEHLVPRDDAVDNDTMFYVGAREDVDKNPSIMAVGIDGQITGTRAHLLIGDDVETMDNTKTLQARDTLFRKCGEFVEVTSFVDPIERRGKGEILVCMTPHHEDSVGDRLAETGFHSRTWPVMLPPKGGDFAREKIKDLAPSIKEAIEQHELAHGPIGDHEIIPTTPYRFGVEDIVRRQGFGSLHFGMNGMLIADLGSQFRPLKLSDLIVPDFDFRSGLVPIEIVYGKSDESGSTARDDIDRVGYGNDRLYRQVAIPSRRDEPNKWAKMKDIRMRVDPSGHGEDETAYAIGGFMAGYVWVMDVGGYGGSYSNEHGGHRNVFVALANKARDLGVRRITVEQNYAGEMFKDSLEVELGRLWIEPGDDAWPQYPDGWRCSVETEGSGSGKKEDRIISSLAGPLAQHRLVIHEDAIRAEDGLDANYELQYQFSGMRPGGGTKHDDRIDALAGLVASFQSGLRGDESVLSKRAQQQAEDDEERRFLDAFGIKRERPRKSVIIR